MPACTPSVKKNQNVILAFPCGEGVKEYDPEGLKQKRTKNSKYTASPQLHLISKCCDLVSFLLWPDVGSATLWLNPCVHHCWMLFLAAEGASMALP